MIINAVLFLVLQHPRGKRKNEQKWLYHNITLLNQALENFEWLHILEKTSASFIWYGKGRVREV